jgi:hypothetical protein
MPARRQFGRVRKLPSGRWQARYPDGSGRDAPAPVTFVSKGDATASLPECKLTWTGASGGTPGLGR